MHHLAGIFWQVGIDHVCDLLFYLLFVYLSAAPVEPESD